MESRQAMIIMFNLVVIWVRFMMFVSAVKQAVTTHRKPAVSCR